MRNVCSNHTSKNVSDSVTGVILTPIPPKSYKILTKVIELLPITVFVVKKVLQSKLIVVLLA